MSREVAAIVLAGGGSERMGRDKALLDAGSGETLIERTLRALAGSFDELVVSVGTAGASEDLERTVRGLDVKAQLVCDRRPDVGPLGGVEAALAAVTRRAAFVLAVDFPEISVPLAELLARTAAAGGHRGCVPRGAGRLQPAYAVYSAALLPAVTAALDAGERRFGALARLPGVCVFDLDDPDGAEALVEAGEERPVERIFRNLNTPEDYEHWLRG